MANVTVTPMMGFVEAVKTCFSKFATFSGRARRSEFWWFYLLNAILGGISSYMVTLKNAKVTDKDIDKFIANLFIDDAELLREAELHGYDFNKLDGMSTRMSNMIGAFKDGLESGVGQDVNRGTKQWLWNATTLYHSNTANYGSLKDDNFTRATKRFDALMAGKAYQRNQRAMELLEAA